MSWFEGTTEKEPSSHLGSDPMSNIPFSYAHSGKVAVFLSLGLQLLLAEASSATLRSPVSTYIYLNSPLVS